MNRKRESLSDRFFSWRNRLLSNPDFQRKARRNPLLRIMARRRARALFDLCSGFVYSQILSSCVQLDLFQLLKSGPLTREQIAQAVDIEQDSIDVLLRSATSLKLLENRGGAVYGLGIHGAALLANPGVCKMIEHHTFFYRDMTDPVSLLNREQDDTMLSMFWDYAGAREQQSGDGLGSEPYTELMSASQAMVAEQIIDSYPLRNHQRILDVGGGDGTFLRTVASAAPDLSLMLFDLPAVAAQAEKAFAKSQQNGQLGNEVRCYGGSVFDDELPQGADVISLVRVIHDHNDDAALAILKRCRMALPRGGTLLLAEPMARERVGDPATDAYFGFYLHAMGRGRPRTTEELLALIEQAGFNRCKPSRTHLPMLTSLLVAKV
ncbi:MAG: methyltransferase [Granulosicoccus sp.]|nr:methyltransferase [Granulosicoccus sp.]